jgi:cyclohexyl-isocyanide hydratase
MRVSIIVFPGVEELDFVGFLEVLAVANRVKGRKWFEAELLGTSKGPIECSGGMKVLPDRVIGRGGDQDLVFVPGGGASRDGRGGGVDLASKDERVMKLLRSAERRGKPVWSVCTGALILGSAGLLKGRRAVTHHSFLDKLAKYGATISRDRIVSDGKITTGGGIASSIDVGLELVRQSLGQNVARQTRERMEYHPPRRRSTSR